MKGALALACVVSLGATGCSLVLDFSPGAIPIDATPDSPANDAECAFGEPNDTFADAFDLPLDAVGPAGICGDTTDDHDFYKITIPAATATMSFQISFHNFAAGDLDLYLYDMNQTLIAKSVGTADNEKITCPGSSPNCPLATPIPEGVYFFEVRGGVTGTQNRYDIAIALTQ